MEPFWRGGFGPQPRKKKARREEARTVVEAEGWVVGWVVVVGIEGGGREGLKGGRGVGRRRGHEVWEVFTLR